MKTFVYADPDTEFFSVIKAEDKQKALDLLVDEFPDIDPCRYPYIQSQMREINDNEIFHNQMKEEGLICCFCNKPIRRIEISLETVGKRPSGEYCHISCFKKAKPPKKEEDTEEVLGLVSCDFIGCYRNIEDVCTDSKVSVIVVEGNLQCRRFKHAKLEFVHSKPEEE